jgi:Mce-associated membrane protein
MRNQTKQRRRVALAAVLATMVLAASIMVAGQWWLLQQRRAQDRSDAVRAAATAAGTEVLSYDYRRLQAGANDTIPLLTGDAKTQYLQLLAPLKQSAPRLKAVVSADVKAAAVLQSDSHSARVLLFVDQTSTSSKLSAPQLDQSRVVVTMTKSRDHWLVSEIAAI